MRPSTSISKWNSSENSSSELLQESLIRLRINPPPRRKRYTTLVSPKEEPPSTFEFHYRTSNRSICSGGIILLRISILSITLNGGILFSTVLITFVRDKGGWSILDEFPTGRMYMEIITDATNPSNFFLSMNRDDFNFFKAFQAFHFIILHLFSRRFLYFSSSPYV